MFPSGVLIQLEFIVFSLVLAYFLVLFLLRNNRRIQEKNERLKAIKEIVDNIHKNFDLENIKKTSVEKIGQVLGADRCIIAGYDEKTKKFAHVDAEYLSPHESTSLGDYLSSIQATRITNICIRNQILNIPNTVSYIKDNHLQETLIESFYKKYNIKSVLAIPIRHSGKVLAVIVFHYSSKFKYFTKEDIRFVTNIADSIGVALYQSNLYKEQQNIARKDSVLRQITETIRITLDIKETKQIIVDEVGRIFNADRCYLRGYDQIEDLFLKPEVEYLRSSEIKSLMDMEPNQQGLSYFFESVKLQRDFIPVEVTQHSFEEEVIKNPALEEYFRQVDIKTDFAIPVWDKKGRLTFLVLHYRDNMDLPEEDKELLVAIAKQVSIALEQANLYNETKVRAEREQIARKIIETIKGTVDLDEILKFASSELLAYLKNIDRIFLGKILFLRQKEFSEVTKLTDMQKVTKLPMEKYLIVTKYWDDYLYANKKNKIISDIQRSDMPQEVKDVYQYMGVKSIAVFPLKSNEEVWGGLFLSSIEKYKQWDDADEIAFLENIVAQVSVAIKQANLYNTQKETAQRERSLRHVIEVIRSSVDISKTLSIICNEIAQVFNVQRVSIVEFVDENDYSKWIVRREYKTRKDIKGLEDIKYDIRAGVYNGITVLKDGQNLVIPDINEYDAPDYYKKVYSSLGIKSILSVPIQSEKIKFGIIFLSSVDSYRDWTQEEVKLLESIASQVYVAIQQAELFNSLKEKVKRETLLRQISEVTKSSSDIKLVKQKIVNLIGKAFNAGRCYIRYFDKVKGVPRKAEVEYKKSVDLPSVLELEPNAGGIQFFLEKEGSLNRFFYINDLDKYLEENNLHDSPVAVYLNELHTKSDYPFVAWEDDKELINIVLHYTDEPHILMQEELDFLEALITQAGYVINQTKMYNEQKETAQKERTLRELTEMIRQSLDISQILHTSIVAVGKILNVRRAFFSRYDSEAKVFITPTEPEEYIGTEGGASFRTFGRVFDNYFPFLCQVLKTTKEPIVIPDSKEFIQKHDIEKRLTEQNLIDKIAASFIVIPIIGNDVLFGGLGVEFDKPFAFSDETVVFLKTISEQIAIALIQAKLYESQKQNAQREKTLRELTNMIRQSFDIREIIETFVFETGRMFDFQRALFSRYDTVKNIFLPPDDYAEYIIEPHQKFYGRTFGNNFHDTYKFLGDMLSSSKKNVFFADREKFIEEYNLENTSDAKNLRDDDMGTVLCIPMLYQDELLGAFACSHKESYKITPEIIRYLESISEQISIAIYQAELLEKEKQSSAKEKILRNIITTMRKTLDIKKIKNYLVNTIADYLNADRVILVEYNAQKNTLLPLDNFSEFLRDPEGQSLIAFDWNSPQIKDYIDVMKQKKDLYVSDVDNYIISNNQQGSGIDTIFEKLGSKSILSIPITYNNEFNGFFCVSFTKREYYITPAVEYFLRILVDQAGIALHQSKLYEFQKKVAYNEKVLKDIISEIKLTRDLNHAYNTLLRKLSEIFSLNRTLFLESSLINPDEVNIKYEYVINRKDMAINNLVFPQVCIDEFLNLIHNLEPLVINDVRQCHPEETFDFFNKYQIKALMSVPLVKYNGETQVLGFIVLCAESVKYWTEEEIELIQIISDSVVSVIWEISKFLETEELRNTFVSTLAHDFQVPLVGERTAIEYLLNYSGCATGGDREILQELLENNENISLLLSKFVDIYNYEAGNKNLEMGIFQVGQVLKEAILVANSDVGDVSRKVNLKEHSPDFKIIVDKKELIKVFIIIIENAITHSYEGTEVNINYTKRQNRLIISVHNWGKAIPQEVQERLFSRYEMALAIERKIGAGTGLFLSKRILEAHKGYIWFETSEEKGTTFYVSLPINK